MAREANRKLHAKLTRHERVRDARRTHFDVREEAETLKKVASDSEATAFASMVFPVPGGPKRSKPAITSLLNSRKNGNDQSDNYGIMKFNYSLETLPFAGFRRPVKRSLLLVGKITISSNVCFAISSPAAKVCQIQMTIVKIQKSKEKIV